MRVHILARSFTSTGALVFCIRNSAGAWWWSFSAKTKNPSSYLITCLVHVKFVNLLKAAYFKAKTILISNSFYEKLFGGFSLVTERKIYKMLIFSYKHFKTANKKRNQNDKNSLSKLDKRLTLKMFIKYMTNFSYHSGCVFP